MSEPFAVRFPDGRRAEAVRVSRMEELPDALAALGLVGPRPTVVVVGGAGGLDDSDLDRLRSLFVEAVVPVIEENGGIGVDGGTLSGVMRLFGETRAAAAACFPLLGVAAQGTIRLPGDEQSDGQRAPLDPRHSHFLLVPGDQWGDESPWIAKAATVLADGAPSITVLINGGQVALQDVERSIDARREVVVISGSGRAADALTAALDGAPTDPQTAAAAARGVIRSRPADDPAQLARALAEVLAGTDIP